MPAWWEHTTTAGATNPPQGNKLGVVLVLLLHPWSEMSAFLLEDLNYALEG